MPKFRNALYELCDKEFLHLVWKDFLTKTPKRKRHSGGLDRVTFIDFENTKESQINSIVELLLSPYSNKTSVQPYQTTPLEVFPMEKPGREGEYRIICIPTIRDRLIQRAVLQLLNSKHQKLGSPMSWGTGPDRTVKKAIAIAKHIRNKRPYVYKTDITNFFDEIPREKIIQTVTKKVRYKSLHPILLASIQSEIRSGLDSETNSIIKKHGIRAGRGLRQGLPLSPFLSNLYLEDFDQTLISAGFKAIRYADDLIILCESENQCQEAHGICGESLKKIGLAIPDIGAGSKTQIYTPTDECEFLGLGITKIDSQYEAVVTKRQIDRVIKKFQAYLDIDNNVSQGVTFPTLVGRLESLVQSYRSHYDEADNSEQFFRTLEKWKVRLVRKILLDNYNFDPTTLTMNQKRFLHLA